MNALEVRQLAGHKQLTSNPSNIPSPNLKDIR